MNIMRNRLPGTRTKRIRKASVHRNNLKIATIEGIPSTIFQVLLQGQFLTGFLLYLGASSSQIGFVLALTTLVNVAQIGVAFLIQKLPSRKWAMVLLPECTVCSGELQDWSRLFFPRNIGLQLL